jgi:translocator protein
MSGSARGAASTVLTAAGLALVAAALAAFMAHTDPWYATLRLPRWRAPDWSFGPAWTLIFGCSALSAAYWWRAAGSDRGRRRMVALYAQSAALAVLWGVLFFTFRRPDWALLEVAALWLSIVALILAAPARVTPPAWLLVPALAWVTYTAMLTFAVVRLNAPFA